MIAGHLKHRIAVTRPLEPSESTQNSFGEDVGTPATVGSFWCHVEFLQGTELEKAMQRWAEAKYKITMRRQPGIIFTRKMVVTWKARALDILDIQDPGDDLRPEIVMYARDFQG